MPLFVAFCKDNNLKTCLQIQPTVVLYQNKRIWTLKNVIAIMMSESIRIKNMRGIFMNYNFGNNIKTLRKNRNLTQEQMAEFFGVSSQAISKWETNISYPDISLLPIIANFFGVSTDELLGYDMSKRDDAINELPADYWRYAIIASAPETDDTDFTIARFADIVNKDLNGMLGNFVSRVCKLTAKNFGNNVPSAGATDSDLESQINEKLAELTTALDACEFRASIAALRGLYAIGNEYMTKMEPWALVKNGDMDTAGAVLNQCFQLIDLYARVSAPFIPTAATKMQNIFTTTKDLSWPEKFEIRIENGAEFVVPENLFNRIDDEKITQLTEKYTPKKEDNTPKPVVAKIVSVENHPSRDDLHILSVDYGADAPVQIVCAAPNVRTGMVSVLAPVGAQLPTIKKPIAQRTVAGVESFGMMCGASELGIGDDDKNIIELGDDMIVGDVFTK